MFFMFQLLILQVKCSGNDYNYISHYTDNTEQPIRMKFVLFQNETTTDNEAVTDNETVSDNESTPVPTPEPSPSRSISPSPSRSISPSPSRSISPTPSRSLSPTISRSPSNSPSMSIAATATEYPLTFNVLKNTSSAPKLTLYMVIFGAIIIVAFIGIVIFIFPQIQEEVTPLLFDDDETLL